jgi:membrane-bound lytic murein transglycosylase B
MFGIAFAPAWFMAGAFTLVSALLSPSGAFAAERRPVAEKTVTAYDRREDVTKFIDEMVERHGFARSELQSLFRKTVFQPAVVKAISPPADPRARSWRNYRAIFVSPDRIRAGQQFLIQHAAALARARAEFGVPEEIITAIIGVETVYGRNMGGFRIVDALTTLAFDYPRRASYFRSELEHYLLYTRDAGVDVFSLRGSYAGAYGLPQFMPASLRRYAVDYDGDARVDLGRSVADAIGSVGNFLKEHGWKPGGAIAFAATMEGEGFRKFADGSVKPAWPMAEISAAGVTALAPTGTLTPETLAVLVELDTPDQPSEYRVALDNFYVITRYNRSSFYAAAVMDLAAALRTPVSP